MTHDSTTATAHEKISTRTLARRIGWFDGAEHATTTVRESGPRLEALYDGTVEEVAGDDLSDLVAAWRWNDSAGEAAAITGVPARWRRQYERAYQRAAASTMRLALRETPEAIADRVGREWGEEMVGQRCYPDGIDDEAQAARDLENCDFDVLRDEMRAAGYADPTERDDWRSLVSASCEAAVARVVELMADDAEDEDDGQPSDLQEHEDFAQDNVFEPYADG